MASTQSRPERAARFTYGGYSVDEGSGVVTCEYLLDGRRYVETVRVGGGRSWTPAAREAARILHLLAGVSYYKAGAPPVIDLGCTPIRDQEAEFLREFYIQGLGEFSARNNLPLDDVQVIGGSQKATPAEAVLDRSRPLIPFGGGIDSIVTVEALRERHPDSALFVLSRPKDRFAAIEQAAGVTRLPVLRADRKIDPAISRSTSLTHFNGHVPITGIISAIAVLVATLHGRGAVVMSNEWSASKGNVVFNGRSVNHQWSKGDAFETMFQGILNAAIGNGLQYFSFLRPFSELWVAKRFATLHRYHSVFHSCNRAFSLDPAMRLTNWCGHCDKCCFIDLILAPFLGREEMRDVFGGEEPLDDEQLLPKFRNLLNLDGGQKPWECVGDADECRTAAVMAQQRSGREHTPVLCQLISELGPSAGAAGADSRRLLLPLGRHDVPDALLAAATLV